MQLKVQRIMQSGLCIICCTEKSSRRRNFRSIKKIPESYIPKITKKLKDANIVRACEGLKGGYVLIKEPEEISL